MRYLTHQYLSRFNIEKSIFSEWHLTSRGEPVASVEYMFKIAESKKTMATFIPDKIPTLSNEPRDPVYVVDDFNTYSHFETYE